MSANLGTPQKYPAIKAGERAFVLCWGPAARYQLQTWGYWLDGERLIPLLALAAAMAGTLNKDGVWKSARFEHPASLAEIMGADQSEFEFQASVAEALKNTAPGATLTLIETPAKPQEDQATAA